MLDFILTIGLVFGMYKLGIALAEYYIDYYKKKKGEK